jgi:hypothetical protein
MTVLDRKALARYRQDPAAFIGECLINPENGRPYTLLAAEVAFMAYAFRTGADGRLLFPDLVYSAIKKSGKTTFGAIFVITLIVLYGDRFAEAYAIANDLEQAQSRVFETCRRIIEASPLLKRETRVTADRILFTATGATIRTPAADYISAAGAAPSISIFDEIWGVRSERARRLWDEMVPVPNRRISCRLVVSHAGFENESELLHELYQRGLKQPLVGTDLHAGDGILMFWSHVPIAPEQTEAWLADMRRTLRPVQYARMIENRFTSTENPFISGEAWDACTDPNLSPLMYARDLPVFAGLDGSTKHDDTAIIAVAMDKATEKVRLVWHRVFTPRPGDPIDFEVVENAVLDLKRRFPRLQRVLFDPHQFVSSSQRLKRQGIPVEEYPQTSPNLTQTSQNLYDLIVGRNLIVYPDPALRLAATRAIAIETSRGWRLDKLKAAHKIDAIVALSMAAWAAVDQQSKPVPMRVSAEAFAAIKAWPGRGGSTPGAAPYARMVRENRLAAGLPETETEETD